MSRPASPRRLAPWRRLCAAAMALVLLAGGCVGGEPDAIAVPTPERNEPALLPPTPRSDETSTADIAGATPDAVPAGDAVASTVPAPAPAVASLACLNLRTQLAQLLLPLAEQPELDTARAIAAAGDLGGLGLLGSPDAQLEVLLAEVQNASFVPVLVASDEEGGTVQRLATLLGPMPAAATTATTSDPAEVTAAWLEYGSRVKALGIDVVFGPVVDVGSGPGIGSRSFGDDPRVVTAYAGAVADGLTGAGVLPVFKHFPGHGRASGDSHLGLPLAPGIDELRSTDLVPYVELVGAGRRSDAAVMIGHLSVPGLSGDLPTSLSPETIEGLLKGEIGFDGLVFTDALNMGAIVDNFGTLDAIERSLLAGADIAILGSLADVAPALDHLVARAESDPSLAAVLEIRVRRVLTAKGQIDICRGAQ